MFDDTLATSRRLHARDGTVFWTNVVGTRLVVALGPDSIETVLANRDGAFSSEHGWGYFTGPFFRRGVMLMDFAEHRHHRLIMQQVFRRERLVAYLERRHPVIAEGVEAWRGARGFMLYAATKQLTLDIATKVFVGAELGGETTRVNRALIDTVVGGRPSSAPTCHYGTGPFPVDGLPVNLHRLG